MTHSSSGESYPARLSAKDGEIHPFVVGIGASAGGLQALEELLRVLPGDLGMSYVLIQHLDPNYPSALVEILQKITDMPVSEAQDGILLEPDHIYSIPPNLDLTLQNNYLTLTPRIVVSGMHLPIDSFFSSLAKNSGSSAIAIVLSGTGSDGSKGIQAIKAEHGIVFAQSESSAKFFGMPKSAIDTGCVDRQLSPKEIAQQLVKLAASGAVPHELELGGEAVEAIPEPPHFAPVLDLLKAAFGVDFTLYKQSTLQRRIVRRMLVHGMQDVAEYTELLKQNLIELKALYNDILINVTAFFRDAEVFDRLKESILPAIIARNEGREPIRIWVAGCSTGEEVYSIMIVLSECLESIPNKPLIQIFATDISERAIEKARQGTYTEAALSAVSEERLAKYFRKAEMGGYRIDKAIRDHCVFSVQNITADPPFSRLDLITCRNVLIYLSSPLQKRVIPAFHYALKQGGHLVLGTSETIGQYSDLFTLSDKKNKIYEKIDVKSRVSFDFHPGSSVDRKKVGGPVQGLMQPKDPEYSQEACREAERLILNRYTPSAVIVNQYMDIVGSIGETAAFLTLPSGVASLNLFKMLKQGLSHHVRQLIAQSKDGEQAAHILVLWAFDDGTQQDVKLEILPLRQRSKDDRLSLLLFHRLPSSPSNHPKLDLWHLLSQAMWKSQPTKSAVKSLEHLQKELAKAHEDLRATEEHLQAIMEAHDAITEELKAAGEEVVSSNEELQSTNEELETSKEELQSINEELNTVNDEVRNRNLELTISNSDLVNVLHSFSIPIIILTKDLRIRRITTGAETVFRLIGADVGRSIGDINLHLEDIDLQKLVKDVMKSLVAQEREVKVQDGRWYSMQIRPYRTIDDKIDGVVVSFADIDLMLRSREYSQMIADTVKEPLIILNSRLEVISANASFYKAFKLQEGTVEGRPIYELSRGAWNLREIRRLLESILPELNRVDDFQVEMKSETDTRMLSFNASKISLGSLKIEMILLAVTDVTEQKQIESIRKKWAMIFEKSELAIAVSDRRGQNLELVNHSFAEARGYGALEMQGMAIRDLYAPAKNDDWLKSTNPIEGAGPTQFESEHRRKDGSVFPVLVKSQQLIDDNGQVICLVINATDLTERKRSEIQFQTIFESSSNALLLINSEKSIVLINRSVEEIFGYKREELVGQPFSAIVPYLELDSHPEIIFDRSIQLEDSAENEWNAIRKDGSRFVIRLNLKPLQTELGKFAIASIIDFTEQKGREQATRDSAQAADVANKAKSEFVANMSHEIRTPLGAILGFAELLVLDDCSASKQHEYIARIRRNVEHLTDLLDEVLDLSKIEAGKIEIDIQSLDLLPELGDTLAILRSRAAEKSLAFKLTFEGPLPAVVHTDSMRMRQILINIIGNAIKFTDQGQVDVTIKLMSPADARASFHLGFMVRDTGFGISAEQSTKLFQAFSQADSTITRRYGGTGLGLSLSRRLANLLGGDVILAESEVNVGSSFLVTIDAGSLEGVPMLQNLTEEQLMATTQEDEIVHGSSLRGIRVLVAEDAPDLRALFDHLLRLDGANVTLAENGQEAVAKARNTTYDVILMDIQMPIVDGFEAMRQLKALGSKSPVIALTAHGMRGDRERCLSAGFIDHLVKPVTVKDLVASVQRFRGP